MPVRQWNPGPHEHRGQRFVHIPTDAIQPPDQNIAALLVALDCFFYAILGPIEGDDARNLQRLKDAVVQIALDLSQRPDDLTIADAKSHTPARHVVCLGQCVELDADVFRTWYLKKTGGSVPVEHDIRISQIMDHNHMMFFGKRHNFFEKLKIHNRGRGIMWKINDENSGMRKRLPIDALDRKSTRLNSSHLGISYAVFCLKKK